MDRKQQGQSNVTRNPRPQQSTQPQQPYAKRREDRMREEKDRNAGEDMKNKDIAQGGP